MAAFIANQRAFKRDQVPDDLVGTILFLAGHGSDFVTGQDIWVSGDALFSLTVSGSTSRWSRATASSVIALP